MSTSDEAIDFLRVLQEPVNLVDKIPNRKKPVLQTLKNTLLPWTSQDFYYVERLPVSQKVQILDFNFPSILEKMSKKIKKTVDYQELHLHKVSLDWEPYISRNMQGRTTVLLGDFRSKHFKNILKGGFTFPSAEPVNNLIISPGYMINLKDPNLHKIFRFIILTSGLDLDDDSHYGRLTFSLHFSMGTSLHVLKNSSDVLTLVTTKKALAIMQTGMGPQPEISENINIEDVVKSFQTGQRNKAPEKAFFSDFNNLNTLLNRSCSVREKANPEFFDSGRKSCVAEVLVGPSVYNRKGKEILDLPQDKNDSISGSADSSVDEAFDEIKMWQGGQRCVTGKSQAEIREILAMQEAREKEKSFYAVKDGQTKVALIPKDKVNFIGTGSSEGSC